MPKAVGVGPKLNALPGTTLEVFKDIALGSMEEFPFKPAYDWKPWCSVLGCGVSAEVETVETIQAFKFYLHCYNN